MVIQRLVRETGGAAGRRSVERGTARWRTAKEPRRPKTPRTTASRPRRRHRGAPGAAAGRLHLAALPAAVRAGVRDAGPRGGFPNRNGCVILFWQETLLGGTALCGDNVEDGVVRCIARAGDHPCLSGADGRAGRSRWGGGRPALSSGTHSDGACPQRVPSAVPRVEVCTKPAPL